MRRGSALQGLLRRFLRSQAGKTKYLTFLMG